MLSCKYYYCNQPLKGVSYYHSFSSVTTPSSTHYVCVCISCSCGYHGNQLCMAIEASLSSHKKVSSILWAPSWLTQTVIYHTVSTHPVLLLLLLHHHPSITRWLCAHTCDSELSIFSADSVAGHGRVHLTGIATTVFN